VTPPFPGPTLKLAYLPPAMSVKELAAAAELPWVEQEGVVLGQSSVGKCRDRCSIGLAPEAVQRISWLRCPRCAQLDWPESGPAPFNRCAAIGGGQMITTVTGVRA